MCGVNQICWMNEFDKKGGKLKDKLMCRIDKVPVFKQTTSRQQTRAPKIFKSDPRIN